jgi:hypothetical protein
MSSFTSKVDAWVAVAIAIGPVAALASAIGGSLSDSPAGIVGWLVLVGVAALYVLIVWPIAYELHPKELVVRFGRMRTRIPYGEISGVKPSRSLVAGPSYSLDRLAIDRGGRGLPVLVSPADRDRFLTDLAMRIPHLRRDGDRLVQAGQTGPR